MLCSPFVSPKTRHGNLKTSVFNFCGSMLPGVADFNAKSNKKNLHDCNEYMNNDELRNTSKFSHLSRYANKQATTKLPRYTQSLAWLHSVHLLCTRQSRAPPGSGSKPNAESGVPGQSTRRWTKKLACKGSSSQPGSPPRW